MLRRSSVLFFFVFLSVEGVSSVPPYSSSALQTHQSPPEGFLWYGSISEPAKKKALDSKEKSPSALTSFPDTSTPEGRNKALRDKLEQAVQKVLDSPTLENAIAAQRLQKVVFERSEEVSKVWMLAALLDAGLLTSKDNPNPLHRKMLGDEEDNKNHARLQDLSDTWGIVVEISENCAYCTAFVPILEELQQKTSMQILGAGNVSTKTYGTFPVQKDKGFLRRYNPERLTPTAYLIHKSGEEIYPVARGVTDAEAIIQNILSVLSFREQKEKKRTL